MGMLGKAWSTGALMMVQVAETLPKGFHPRTKLEGVLHAFLLLNTQNMLVH